MDWAHLKERRLVEGWGAIGNERGSAHTMTGCKWTGKPLDSIRRE